MAIQETPSVVKVRQMTVCNLSGKWLQEIGFRAGHVIDIVCEDGKLTVTIAKEQRFEDV